jgi:hypothetical protein
VRYRATDVYTFLTDLGCSFDGERYPHGQVWLAPGEYVFFRPDPDQEDGNLWFDAEVPDDNLKDRWVGFKVPLRLTRF